MRSGLLLNGRFERTTRKEARSLSMILRLRRAAKAAAKEGSEGKILDAVQGMSRDGQIAAAFAGLMLCEVEEQEKRTRKSRPKKFRIPIQLQGGSLK